MASKRTEYLEHEYERSKKENSKKPEQKKIYKEMMQSKEEDYRNLVEGSKHPSDWRGK